MREEEIRKSYYEDDEIDLYELWLTLKKRWKIVLITTLSFFTFAVIYILISPPIYLIKHTYSVFNLQNLQNFQNLQNQLISQIGSAISNLSDYLKSKDLKVLSKELAVPEATLKSLKEISFSTERRKPGVFSISLEGTKREELKAIDEGIKHSILHLPPIKEYISSEQEKLTKTLEVYQSNLSKLKSLARETIEKLKNNDLKVLGFNPLDVEGKIIYYETKINEIKILLRNLQPIKEVSVFFPKEPVKPKKKLLIAVALISGLFLGVFLAFFAEWLSNIKERNKEER